MATTGVATGERLDAAAAGCLLARLRSVEQEIARAVERRSMATNGTNGNGHDAYGQGLFISPADVAALLAPTRPDEGGEAPLLDDATGGTAEAPAPDRGAMLSRVFGL